MSHLIDITPYTPGCGAVVRGGWHTNHSYDQIPALGSILVARELPATGWGYTVRELAPALAA